MLFLAYLLPRGDGRTKRPDMSKSRLMRGGCTPYCMHVYEEFPGKLAVLFPLAQNLPRRSVRKRGLIETTINSSRPENENSKEKQRHLRMQRSSFSVQVSASFISSCSLAVAMRQFMSLRVITQTRTNCSGVISLRLTAPSAGTLKEIKTNCGRVSLCTTVRIGSKCAPQNMY